MWSIHLFRRLARPALPRLPDPRQHRRQELPRITPRRLHDVFRPAPGDHFAAAVAAFWAEVDYPVGGFYHFEIVLDHDDGVALRHQLVQHFQQLLYVVEMQPRRRLVQDIEGAPRRALAQFFCQFDTLGFAAGECRRLLADMDVVEADAMQRLKGLAHAGDRLEKFSGFFHRHVEHVGDRLALEQNFQRLAVVALALADVAGDVDVGQEVHLDLDDAVALAGLAAAALDVEGKPAGLIAAPFRFSQA